MRCAVVDDNTGYITNWIVADPSTDALPGHRIIKANGVNPKSRWNGSGWISPRHYAVINTSNNKVKRMIHVPDNNPNIPVVDRPNEDIVLVEDDLDVGGYTYNAGVFIPPI